MHNEAALPMPRRDLDEEEQASGHDTRVALEAGQRSTTRPGAPHLPQKRLTMEYLEHFHEDPRVCGGEPVIKGTRVTLRTLLASLGEGGTMDEILADYPSITEDDLRAVIAFAAASAGEDLPIPPLPKVA